MVNLILGRAGTGKTRRIMEEISQRADLGETDLTLVVPEQYTHSGERQLLEICGDKLSLHGQVLSFKRLALRVREETGRGNRYLDSGGALLALYRAIRSVSSRLHLYGGPMGRVQFLKPILTTITELRNCGVTSGDLMNALDDKSSLSDKLHDLSLILEAFEAHIQISGDYDSSAALMEVSTLIADSSYKNHKFYFDGFTDFTVPELDIIKTLMSSNTELTFCFTLPDFEAEDESFRLARETANLLVRYAADYNRECNIFYMEENSLRPADLRFMEQHLFATETCEFQDVSTSIRLFTAPDPATECRYAAAEILRLVKEGMRWRDISVMFRGDRSYNQLCESIFSQYGIPVFLSGREDILDRPPISLILSALDIVSSNWSYDDVFTYLKTGLSGISQDDLDLLENFIIRRNIRGSMWYRKAPWAGAEEKIDHVRRIVADPVYKLGKDLSQSPTCLDMLKALYDFLMNIDLPNSIMSRSEDLRRLGHIRAADEYLQIWDIIVGALDQMDSAAGDATMTVGEFSSLLKMLLSCYDVGVIPISLDRVIIGDISMSRRRNLRALILLGANDKNLPLVSEQQSVFSDGERDELVKNFKITSIDTFETFISHEFATIYGALTMPSERLTIMFNEAEGARPSFVMADLEKMFNLKARSLNYHEYAPVSEFKYKSLLEGKTPKRQGLSQTAAKYIYGEKLRLSPTRVERLASCKFAFFMESGLRLSPREREEFDALAAGTLTHYVLEGTARSIQDGGGFQNAAQEDVRRLTQKYTHEFVRETYPDFNERPDRFRYLLRRLSKDIERVALDLTSELSHSEFKPMAFEMDFRTSLPDGFLDVTGIIDRVDGWKRDDTLYIRVSDYKTGSKTFSLSDVLHGLNMQLLIYLYALSSEEKKIIPAAMLYTPARDKIFAAEKDMSDEAIAKELSKSLRRDGLVLADKTVVDAMETRESKIYLPHKDKSLVTLPQFWQLLSYAENRLAKLGNQLRQGDISVAPYYKNDNDHSCKFCKYSSICGFGAFENDDYRHLKTLRSDEFWDELNRKLKKGGEQDE